MEERPSPEVEPEEQQQSITQESPNPPEEAPDDARFLAEQNRVVEEETVARSRSMVRDDEDPQAAAPSAEPEPETGNASTEQVAELEDEQGSDERLAMTEQAESAQEAREEQAAVAAVPPSQVQPEGEQGDNETVINDGFGTLRLPSAPSTENRHPSANRASAGVLEQPGWSALEGIVGREALEEEREVHAAQQRSRTRGAAREQRWREFRAAIENFTPTVRPGNQTALNAAASPFAAYLAAVHRRIHRQFAHRFLQGLPTWSTSPFSDSTLMTRLEIVFNQAGTIHEIGVVRSSGFEPFDLGAFNAVMRAQPYPRAPDSILSGDGRVYVHWGFYRSHRQCGTFNARPYIIPHPNGRPAVPQGPIDEPEEPTSPTAAETGNASALLNERPRRRAG